MRCRDRTALDVLRQGLALRVIRQCHPAGGHRVDQAIRTGGVYASHFFKTLIVYMETQCAAAGHKHFRVVGKPADIWGATDLVARPGLASRLRRGIWPTSSLLATPEPKLIICARLTPEALERGWAPDQKLSAKTKADGPRTVVLDQLEALSDAAQARLIRYLDAARRDPKVPRHASIIATTCLSPVGGQISAR